MSKVLLDTLCEIGLPNRLKTDLYGFVDAKEINTFERRLAQEIETMGGTIVCNAETKCIKTFFGWPRSIEYLRNGALKKMPAKTIVLAADRMDFIKGLTQRNSLMTKSSPRFLKVYIQQKRADYERAFTRSARGMSLPYLDSRLYFKTKDGRQVFFEGGIPCEKLINVSEKDNYIDLGVRVGNGTETVSSVYIEMKDGENAFLEELGTQINKRERPFAIPVEKLAEFISGKDPLKLGTVYPAYDDGAYLANFRMLLPDSIADSLNYAFGIIGKRFPFYIDPNALILGFGATRGCEFVVQTDEEKKTNIRSVYSALPLSNLEEGVLEEAVRGYFAALGVLKER